MSQLFRPITLRELTVRNRVWVAPMCQYSAVDGVPDDWHLVHLGSFARGGAGLVLTEATAVLPEGRISPADTGLWNDEQQRAWSRIVDFLHARGRGGRHPARPRRAQGLGPGAVGRARGSRRRGRRLDPGRAVRVGVPRTARAPAAGRRGHRRAW